MRKELDPDHVNRFVWWFQKLNYQNDSFIRFIVLWFIFNAWITTISQKDRDRSALNWFYKNRSNLKDIAKQIWQKSEIQDALTQLK